MLSASVAEVTRCLMCKRCVTGGTAFCVRHIVAGVGRPFVRCAAAPCELPCRGATLCVVHGGGLPRSAFEEDVVALHKKLCLKERLGQLGVVRSSNAPSDDDEEDEVATPSWRVQFFCEAGSPLLQAHLEEEHGVVGEEEGRSAKLRKVEQLYALQVARLEDVLRSGDNQLDSLAPSANPAVWPAHSPAPEPPVPERVVQLSQREAGSVVACRRKGCVHNALLPSQFCQGHICEDSKQTLFAPCAVCKTPVLRVLCSDTCPTHTPPAPKMKPSALPLK